MTKFSVQNRLIWIDYAKFIGIYLVIIGHTPLNSSIINFIYTFHMPLFFLISGYLHKQFSIGVIKHNIKSLLIPYILLYIIYWIYPILKSIFTYTFSIQDIILKPFWGMCIGNGYSGSFYTIFIVSLYFLIALFWMRIMYHYFSYLSATLKILIIFSCFLFIYVRQLFHWDFYFSIDCAIMAFPFYALGGYLKLKQISISELNKRKKIFLFFACLCTTLIACKENGRTDINHCIYGNNIFIFYLAGICGSFMVIILSSLGKKLRFVEIISKGTILILAYGSVFVAFYDKLLPDTTFFNNYKYLFIGGIALCSMYPLIIIILKYFPILMGKYNHSQSTHK